MSNNKRTNVHALRNTVFLVGGAIVVILCSAFLTMVFSIFAPAPIAIPSIGCLWLIASISELLLIKEGISEFNSIHNEIDGFPHPIQPPFIPIFDIPKISSKNDIEMKFSHGKHKDYESSATYQSFTHR